MLKDNCFFEIRGLTVTCQVKKRAHPSQLTASLFHSMCESFSSKDVAEECLRQNDIGDQVDAKSTDIPTPSGTVHSVTIVLVLEGGATGYLTAKCLFKPLLETDMIIF